MFLKPWTVAASLVLSCASLRATDPHDSKIQVTIQELHPFTHVVRVPEGADPGTIRFKRAKQVKVATRVRITSDPAYCEKLQFGDPGGSSHCPETKAEGFETAYEVTYSSTGQALTSEEFANSDSTFSVYFRPEELPSNVQHAIAKKGNSSDLARYFAVTTNPETERRQAIDDTKSHICAGNPVDGAWTRTDPKCKDDIRYSAVTVPSGYVKVRVEPVSQRPDFATAAGK